METLTQEELVVIAQLVACTNGEVHCFANAEERRVLDKLERVTGVKLA